MSKDHIQIVGLGLVSAAALALSLVGAGALSIATQPFLKPSSINSSIHVVLSILFPLLTVIVLMRSWYKVGQGRQASALVVVSITAIAFAVLVFLVPGAFRLGAEFLRRYRGGG